LSSELKLAWQYFKEYCAILFCEREAHHYTYLSINAVVKRYNTTIISLPSKMPSSIGLLSVLSVACLVLSVPIISGYPSLLMDGHRKLPDLSPQRYRRFAQSSTLLAMLLNNFAMIAPRRSPREAEDGNGSGHNEYHFTTVSSVENDNYVYSTEVI
jgi:hypothetical protein